MGNKETTKSLLGRGVIIVLPLVIIAMLVLIMFPTRYYYRVGDGQLSLWVGKSWLDAQRSKVMEPIFVGTADFSDLTQQSFATESEALNAIGSLIAARMDAIKEELYPLEKQLAAIYKEFLGCLRVAQRIGLQDDENEIAALQGWLDQYQARLQQERAAGSKLITATETSPHKMIGSPVEKPLAKAKVVEENKEKPHPTAPATPGHGTETAAHHAVPKAEHK